MKNISNKIIKTSYLLIAVFIILPYPAFATSGACSYHNGVDCSASSYSGSVVCNDGWLKSSVSYSEIKECSNNLPRCPIPFTQTDLDSAKASYVTADVNLSALTQKYQNDTNAILNGTYPLGTFQQTQIDASNARFQQLLQTQMTANKSYENSIALSDARMGIQDGSALQKAISRDQQKISDLEAQHNLSISQIKQKFLDAEYINIKHQYDTNYPIAMQQWTIALNLSNCTVVKVAPALNIPASVVATSKAVLKYEHTNPVVTTSTSAINIGVQEVKNANGSKLLTPTDKFLESTTSNSITATPTTAVNVQPKQLFILRVGNFLKKLKFW